MKKKVLVVEDEKPLSKAIEKKLSHEDFEVLTAFNGENGLNTALKERPDLILLDVIMPKMDGFEVLEKLREDEWGKDVEVILLTNLGDSSRVKNSDQNHIDYLIKSDWKLKDIITKINEKLK